MLLMEQEPKPLEIRAKMESSKPFAETFRSILDLEDISLREVARRCETRGWGSISMIAKLGRGEIRPSENAMQHVATALETKPETFAEYRLLQARKRLDPEEVGLDAALRELDRIAGV